MFLAVNKVNLFYSSICTCNSTGAILLATFVATFIDTTTWESNFSLSYRVYLVLKDSYSYLSILVASSPGKGVIADHESFIVPNFVLFLPALINLVEGDEWLDDGVEYKFG